MGGGGRRDREKWLGGGLDGTYGTNETDGIRRGIGLMR